MLPPAGIQTTDEMEEVVDIVLEFQGIFIDSDGKVGFTNHVKHTIDTHSHLPMKVPGHRMSLTEKEHIATEV